MPSFRPLLRLAHRMVVQPVRYCWQHKAISAIVAVMVAGFYWYEIRPIAISRGCTRQASADARQLLKSKAEITKDTKTRASYASLIEKNMYLRSDYESFLQKCLLHYGFRIVPADSRLVTNEATSSTGAAEAAKK